MDNPDPNILQMVRAQFLFGIVFPLGIGTLVAISLTGTFSVPGFLIVMVIGIGLHISTDVYNDIYDTKQGADIPQSGTRNYYSGGSGFLAEKPNLMNRMYLLARLGILFSFLAMIGLLFFISMTLWISVIIIYLIAAFLSKYYTAAPVKLGYRGFGEFVLWFGFGPLAITLAVLSQNMIPNATVYAVIPVTGFTTLTVLWAGQLVDLPSDIAVGKRGMVARIGSKNATYGYMIIQAAIIINTLLLSFFVIHNGWFLLIALVPFVIVLPRIWRLMKKYHADAARLVPLTNLNSWLYGSFSCLFTLGLGLAML